MSALHPRGDFSDSGVGPGAEIKSLPVKGLTPARRGGPRRSVIDALIADGRLSPEYAARRLREAGDKRRADREPRRGAAAS